ncbi:type IV secretory pathway VirB6 component (fragment) [Escherichia coli]
MRYGVRTSVRATDVWHSVCAERLITGYKFQKSIGCIQIAKSNRRYIKEGANKRGNSSRLTQSFHFFMFEPIFSPVNALNQPI